MMAQKKFSFWCNNKLHKLSKGEKQSNSLIDKAVAQFSEDQLLPQFW